MASTELAGRYAADAVRHASPSVLLQAGWCRIADLQMRWAPTRDRRRAWAIGAGYLNRVGLAGRDPFR